MSVLISGSMVSGQIDEANATSGTPPSVGADGDSGSGYSVEINAATTAVRWFEIYKRGANGRQTTALNLADTYTEFFIKFTTLPAANSEEICRVVTSGGTLKLSVRVTSAGKLAAYNTSNAQLGSDGSTVLVTGTWYRIGVYCGTGASASYEIRINRTTELSGTGDLNATNAGGVRYGKVVNQNSQTVVYNIRDYYIADTAFLTNTTLAGAALLPTENGTDTDWSGAFGDYDERPHDGDTTSGTSAANNDAETVGLTEASTAGITGASVVHDVETYVWVKRAGASNGAVVARTRSGATTTDTGTNFATTSAYQVLGQTHITDPNTSSAWSSSGINSLQIGVVSKNGVNDSTVTAMHCYVLYSPVTAVPRIWEIGTKMTDGGIDGKIIEIGPQL